MENTHQIDIGKNIDAHFTTSPRSTLVAEFYEYYDMAFAIDSEKEELEGFVACLILNEGEPYKNLEQKHGTFQEPVVVFKDADTKTVLGGSNFLALRPRSIPNILCIHINYIFIVKEHRRRGLLKTFVAAIPIIAAKLLSDCIGKVTKHRDCLIFLEQNDPLKMTNEEFDLDTRLTGINQFDRLRIWAKLGAMFIDIAYVQPALSQKQNPTNFLVLSVIGASGQTLDPRLLYFYLRAFFEISVLKGKCFQPTALEREQFHALDHAIAAGHDIGLLDPTRWLAANPTPSKAELHDWMSIKDAVRLFQSRTGE